MLGEYLNKLTFNLYWIFSSITMILIILFLPIQITLLVLVIGFNINFDNYGTFLIVYTCLQAILFFSWTLSGIFFKCPHCHLRSHPRSYFSAKRVKLTKRYGTLRYLIPGEVLAQESFCINCEKKIEVRAVYN